MADFERLLRGGGGGEGYMGWKQASTAVARLGPGLGAQPGPGKVDEKVKRVATAHSSEGSTVMDCFSFFPRRRT